MAKIIGIDLGTTNSCVAVMEGSTPKVIENAEGARTTPSIVAFTEDGERLVGQPAKRQSVTNPERTFFAVKRLIGRRYDDPMVEKDKKLVPYKIVKASNGDAWVEADGQTYSPSQVSAFILQKMKETAEAHLGQKVDQAVITVPAYFNDAQRQATKDAARLAGLNVLRLLNEPTAAAIAYGLDNGSEGIYAVYDLGGGTFDISILRLSKGVFEVMSTGGDSALGGDDFDQRILCWISETAKLAPLAAMDARLLLTKAREAKEYLTGHNEAPITAKLTSGELVNLKLSAEVFNDITQTLVAKTLQPCKKALRDAGLRPTDVKGVVMVGGATRIPAIQKAVGEFFRQEPLTNLDPDKVVAIGAATQANLLAGNRNPGDDWLLLDVIPLSLGLETMGGLTEKVIPRNSTIPVARAQEFTTFKDGQTAMAIHVVQGERELVSDCRSLARFELRGIPPMVAGAPRIRVTFQVDADGLLSVTAREQTSGVEASVAVKPSYGLTDDEITGMLQSSLEHAKDDAFRRALQEARVEADRLLEATEAALKEDPHLLDAGERARVDVALEKLRTVIQGEDRHAINHGMDLLALETNEFAARRMDQSIKRALAGKRVDDVKIGEEE